MCAYACLDTYTVILQETLCKFLTVNVATHNFVGLKLVDMLMYSCSSSAYAICT
jgi:hypothetical protein